MYRRKPQNNWLPALGTMIVIGLIILAFIYGPELFKGDNTFPTEPEYQQVDSTLTDSLSYNKIPEDL